MKAFVYVKEDQGPFVSMGGSPAVQKGTVVVVTDEAAAKSSEFTKANFWREVDVESVTAIPTAGDGMSIAATRIEPVG